MSDRQWLSAREAAARLGVKVETLYAYVSRGMLARERTPGRRASRFSARDVEDLARRARPATTPVDPSPVLHTHLTAIEGGALYYRGRDATELACTCSFERVAEWLWSGDQEALESLPSPHWETDPALVAACIGAQASLPEETPVPDRLRLVVATLGPLDPFRYDLSPPLVRTAGRRMIATAVEALPERVKPGGPSTLPGGDTVHVATRLWSRLAGERAGRGLIETLNAALVLLTDHELASSTFASRVAASVRADPYSVVTAGLGAVAGRLHGGVGPQAVELLLRIGRPAEVVAVISEHLKRAPRLPGFGHPVYGDAGDPRARAVLEGLRHATLSRGQRARLATVERVLEVVGTRAASRPNIDFALAGLCYVGRMAPSASEAIFAIARTAGWLAHALEEYEEPPLRFRARAEYAGPPARSGGRDITDEGKGRTT